jgi:hypothetical protein
VVAYGVVFLAIAVRGGMVKRRSAMRTAAEWPGSEATARPLVRRRLAAFSAAFILAALLLQKWLEATGRVDSLGLWYSILCAIMYAALPIAITFFLLLWNRALRESEKMSTEGALETKVPAEHPPDSDACR